MVTFDPSAERTDDQRSETVPDQSPAVVVVDIVAAGVAILLLLAVGLAVSGVPTLLVSLAFVTFVPGWAVLVHVPVSDGTSKVALAVALSLAMTAGSCLVTVWLDFWRPRLLLEATAAVSLVSLIAHLDSWGRLPRTTARSRRSHRARPKAER